MGHPVVWEGSAFAQCLAEALADEDASQPARASQLLQTVPRPDAAAARLLAGLEPECVVERDDADGPGSASRPDGWVGRWFAAMHGLTQSSVRGAAIQAYVQQCKHLVQASRFGSRVDQGLATTAPAAGAAELTPAMLSSDNHQEKGTVDVHLTCAGWEREWLERGRLAGGAGCLVSAAVAAVVPVHLLNSDRPRVAAAVGLASIPVLAVAACWLHGTTADARLALLLRRNLDALSRSIDGMTTCAAAGRPARFESNCMLMHLCATARRLQQVCQEAIRTIQEVELLARGYNVVPTSSNALPPISRLERRDRERRCQRYVVATSSLAVHRVVSAPIPCLL